MNRITFTTVVAFMLLLTQSVVVNASEIKIWTARALATVLAEVGPQFERETGHRLNVVSDLPAGFARRAKAGEQFDMQEMLKLVSRISKG